MSHATLIYNPVAGRKPARREQQIRQAAAALEEAGIGVRLARTSAPGEAGQLARDAVRQGDKLVLVCGGDGTINEVINGLVGPAGVVPGEVTLGILPGGTANIIAKELELPHHPVRAARELPRWRWQRVPLGQATWPAGAAGLAAEAAPRRRSFMSIAGVGFDAYVVYKLADAFKMSLGVVAYCLEAVRQALRYSFPVVVYRTDAGESRATFAVIQRTRRYAGWLHLAPQARFFEPEFQVCLFKSRNRARYFLYAAAVLARQHLRLDDVELVRAQKISCTPAEAGARVGFELDGEYAGELPATFEVVPDALTLLVP